MIYAKMKALEWSQHLSHNKSMGIFKTFKGSYLYSPRSDLPYFQTPFLILWLSLLPAKMKKIQSKMKALKWSQHYQSIFKMLKDS